MSYQARLRYPLTHNDHALGPGSAPIVLIEYGDFECPYCARAYGILRRVRRDLTGDIRFAFRNFPLTDVHPNALNAARAAEAAARQGRFWDMHDLLFENRLNLEEANLYALASVLELDMDRFDVDFESDAVERKIAQDIEGGVRSGVNGTPTFFVNGFRYDGDWSYEPFREALLELAQAVR
jgi:protein-disulfide isomerase